MVYFLEIRQRALHTMIFFIVLMVLFVLFSKNLITGMITPLLHVLPDGERLLATNITSPLCTPINLAFNAATLCTAPVFLYHVWRFILPGLYDREKAMIKWVIISSLLLFIAGATVAFTFILPWMLDFFTRSVPEGVRFVPEMNSAIDFICHMIFLFGICFQIPLICPVLVRMGVTSSYTLKQIRPYVVVASFIFGMIITPPDVTSQIIVAVPCCLLYELGILLASRCSIKELENKF